MFGLISILGRPGLKPRVLGRLVSISEKGRLESTCPPCLEAPLTDLLGRTPRLARAATCIAGNGVLLPNSTYPAIASSKRGFHLRQALSSPVRRTQCQSIALLRPGTHSPTSARPSQWPFSGTSRNFGEGPPRKVKAPSPLLLATPFYRGYIVGHSFSNNVSNRHLWRLRRIPYSN